jgi:hypothetical protein
MLGQFLFQALQAFIEEGDLLGHDPFFILVIRELDGEMDEDHQHQGIQKEKQGGRPVFNAEKTAYPVHQGMKKGEHDKKGGYDDPEEGILLHEEPFPD